MKNSSNRIKLDWTKLLAFSQMKPDQKNGKGKSLKSPVMTMFGGKTGAKGAKA